MPDTWFISDTHFGHKNILEYEPNARPFKTLTEMHEVMIERWNSVVKITDTIYHLGDFAFGKHNINIAEKLNGKKKLIMGNHDTYKSTDYLTYFDKLYGVIFWERCILSHMPVHSNGLGARWLLNVHGHLHSRKVNTILWTEDYDFSDQKIMTLNEDKNYFNVSCEQNNLTPIHADIIRQRLKDLS
jgi:calcineurin-like phosphoesterase family protein